jgi:hypothetical protein
MGATCTAQSSRRERKKVAQGEAERNPGYGGKKAIKPRRGDRTLPQPRAVGAKDVSPALQRGEKDPGGRFKLKSCR